MNPKWAQDRYNQFITAFASMTNLSEGDAETQWAAYSRSLTDESRREIEARGARSGRKEGRGFNEWEAENL